MRRQLRSRLGEIGVAVDDHRRGVSELEQHLLPRRALADAPADLGRAGERDRLDAFVLDQHVADLTRGPDEDVEPARRQARLVLELRERERRQRSLARRLEHDGTAGRECGRDLVRDEVEREVERADRADDPDRLPERERELAFARLGGVHGHDLARELARLDGRERVGRHRAARLDLGGLERLARLGGDLGGDLVMAARDSRDGLDEDLGALVRRKRVGHRLLGCVDSGLCLGRAGLRDAAHDVARVRRANLLPLARLDPLAADQEFPLGRGSRHDGRIRP